jgi:hypothetical protein
MFALFEVAAHRGWAGSCGPLAAIRSKAQREGIPLKLALHRRTKTAKRR